jgi:predicted RNA-binding Zn-ribbon protein involved in translation (DUF1610 family)
MTNRMKILNIDIETRPALAYIWDLKTRYVQPEMLVEPKRMLCFAAKWVDDDEVVFASEWGTGQYGMRTILRDLLHDADAVLHYNGIRFDLPHIRTALVQGGLCPPSPFRQIDLYRTVSSKFALMSNRLDEVAKAFGLTRKLETGGFQLWRDVMVGDVTAQRKMMDYNIGDLTPNEELYKLIRPWIESHPSVAALTGEHECPVCGSTDLRREGWYHTQVSRYQRYQCRACGKWSYGGKRVHATTMRGITP